MGLKNTNYKIGNNIYSNVYAVFNGNIRRIGSDFLVEFNIDTSREYALSEQPLTVRTVRLTDWDRKTDIVAYAYEKGKEKIKELRYNEELDQEETVEVDGVFTGWENDIVN